MEYKERLQVKRLKLPTIAYRRLSGDKIDAYKIDENIYDNKVTSETEWLQATLVEQATRPHCLKMGKDLFKKKTISKPVFEHME